MTAFDRKSLTKEKYLISYFRCDDTCGVIVRRQDAAAHKKVLGLIFRSKCRSF